MWEGLDRSRDRTTSPLTAVREAENDITHATCTQLLYTMLPLDIYIHACRYAACM